MKCHKQSLLRCGVKHNFALFPHPPASFPGNHGFRRPGASPSETRIQSREDERSACSLGRLTRRGSTLPSTPGACVALVSVRVFYQRALRLCMAWPNSPTLCLDLGLAGGQGPARPTRTSALALGCALMHCSPDGEWLVPVEGATRAWV